MQKIRQQNTQNTLLNMKTSKILRENTLPNNNKHGCRFILEQRANFQKNRAKKGKICRSHCENSVLSIMNSEAGTRYISAKLLPCVEGTRAEGVKPKSFHQRQWLKYEMYSCISNFVLLTKSYKVSGHMALFDKIIFSIQQKYQLGTQFWSETQH